VIHILDGLTVLPGSLGEVRRRIDEDYLPVAATLGMRRLHTWIAPAVELADRSTELLILWELDDVPGYWAAKRGGATDPQVGAFWSGLEPLLSGRTRRIMADPDDPTVLR